jgi:hypothetical protein
MYFSRVLTAIKLHRTDSRRFCVMETVATRAILATDRDAPPGSTLGVKHDNQVSLSVSWQSRREATRYESDGPGTMCSAVVLRRHWHSPCVRTASCAFLQRVRGQRASPASSGTLDGRQAVAARRRGQLCLMQPCVHTGAGAGADNCSARTEASLLHDSRTPSRPLPCRSLAEVKHLEPSTNLSPWLPISRRAGRIAKFMS